MQVQNDLGKLVLRLAAGGLMLFHGIHKVTGGIDGLVSMTESAGLPSFLAYGVYVGEVVVPVMLVIGLLTRLSAGILGLNMVAAIYIAHSDQIMQVNDNTGAWAIEPAMWFLLASVAILLLGPGKIAVDTFLASGGNGSPATEARPESTADSEPLI
jgi:putative oxidoreductase